MYIWMVYKHIWWELSDMFFKNNKELFWRIFIPTGKFISYANYILERKLSAIKIANFLI